MIGEEIGHHRILAKLGQGGMGTVYQAEDIRLGRRVAMKFLNPTLMANPTELERFRSEATVQAGLNHPNVVTLHGFEPYKDSYYMVMEWVEGKTLAELVRSRGALPSWIVVSLAKQILEGLGAAHRMGVVHRDLKPSNIMVTAEGIAKVMDFGIAKTPGGKALTASGALVGTVFYMSPEQVRGETLDARSDIYALGIILFELLTGRVPFREESEFSIMVHHVQTPPPPPTQFLPDIPGELEDLVLRCLEKAPAQRFADVHEILTALDGFEEQERALGRGQLYTRRFLAQWLADPDAAGAARLAAAPATASSSGTPLLSDSAPPPIPAEPARGGNSGPASSPRRNAVMVIAVLLVAAGLSWGAYVALRRPLSFSFAGSPSGRVPPVAASVAQPASTATGQLGAVPAGQSPSATAGPAVSPPAAAEPGAAPGATGAPVASTAATQPAAAPTKDPTGPSAGASRVAGTPAEAPTFGAAGLQPGAPGARAIGSRASGSPPASLGTQPTRGGAGEGALVRSASAGRTADPRTRIVGGAGGGPRARQAGGEGGPAQQPLEARGTLIFLDQDQGSERLGLGSAQGQAAEILGREGYQVVSGGVVSSGARQALDRGNLDEVRRLGVGFVVLGTAHGSLEIQNAYGSTLHVGKVRVRFEVVRMSDGKVAATGSADARSRGSADPGAALSNALLTATSDAARELARNFHP